MAFEHIAGLTMDILLAGAESTTTTTTAPAAAPGGQPAAKPSDPFSIIYIMIPMIAVMWYFMIRPNQKRERERQDMLSKLAKGDRVITSSGIVGSIVGLSEKSVVLRVSDDPPVKLEFMRAAVSRVAAREENESK
ncbi:MAG: preprotein translocase subunit YajC [Candidatus Hydrogenedentes bacterium]|nr:preprotein translocase subunit YajC [Candidatus Hydrogenedentota bacterium]